jgi:hypothetical protein
MRRVTTLLTFAAGCASGAVLFWTHADLGAQAPGAIHVCAASDGVLRLAQDAGCPAAQRTLYLPGPGTQAGNDPKPKNDSPSKQRIASLEQRIAELEQAGGVRALPHTAQAPFEVKDRSGRVIFRVDRNAVSLFNREAKPVVQMLASDDGGRFKARSGTVDMDVSLLAEGPSAGVVAKEAGTTRVHLGSVGAGYSLTISGKDGNTVAGIGQTKPDGVGLVVVGDQAGEMKAALQVTDGRGMVAVQSSARVPVANLSQGANGGGHFQLVGPDRQVMVEAGVAKDGYGVVRAGPAGFAPGYGVLGLPGSYIVGKK